jgi:hypothetical protein
MITVAPIVEGHAEVESVPILIRRIAASINPEVGITVARPFREPADRLRKPDMLERAIELLIRKYGRSIRILILLDCDWLGCCPKSDGPLLSARATRYAPDVQTSVVLAHREFECWFIAAGLSIQGTRGLQNPLPQVDNPENIRGAKEWLTDHMPRSQPYASTDDQPAFCNEIDLTLARRAPSFDKFFREVQRLIIA